MNTIDIRTETSTNIRYVEFADPLRDGDYFASRIDLNGNYGRFYIDEGSGSGDTVRVHRDDIDNLILALKRAKDLLK